MLPLKDLGLGLLDDLKMRVVLFSRKIFTNASV